MPKNSLQDVIKIKRENKSMSSRKEEDFDSLFVKKKHVVENLNQNYKKDNSKGIWFIALISIIFLFFAISILFAGAKITIDPKFKEFDLNNDFVATKNSNGEDLTFDIIALSGKETKKIPAGEEKDYDEKARGKIVVYNIFSEKPQSLSQDTRLEGTNGKIYKTLDKVVVPGMNKDGDPGYVEVDIYATSSGEEYNSPPMDFKIYGFKGTSKYDKFYARSKGDITGGLKGKSRQVNEEDKLRVTEELKKDLMDNLFSKAVSQIPDGFILFKDSVFLSINKTDFSVVPGDDIATAVMDGTLYGFIFNEKKFTKKIAQNNLDKYDGEDIFMPNIKDLTFSLQNKENIDFKNVESINFSLSGNTKIVWRFDADKFMKDILGTEKKEFNSILSEYKNVSSANLIIKPAWKTTVPYKESDVKIIVNYPK